MKYEIIFHLLTRQLNTSNGVIPAKAGIQAVKAGNMRYQLARNTHPAN
jgi:hypothetical protein